MVREITLMEYFEEHLDIKCEEVNLSKKPFNKLCSGIFSKSKVLEQFVFLTNLSPREIEDNAMEFYGQQGYEPLKRETKVTGNLYMYYEPQRRDETRTVSFTLSPRSGLAVVLQYE